MIRFEEHEGQLFRMLEKPVPLAPDAEMPCLVRLIQDDSPMGIFNVANRSIDELNTIIISPSIDDSGRIEINTNINAHYSRFEIIGYPVEEGSSEWALWAMMEDNKVINSNSTMPFTLTDDRIVRIDDSVSWDVGHWLRIFDDTTSWQIYKEPELKYKAGDFVEIRNWDSDTTHLAQIDSIDHEIHIGTHRFDISGKSVMERVPQLSIIHKLKPSEVVVEIGCLSGTVRPVSTNGTHIWFHLISAYDETIATIRISCLDVPTRSLVESLLKAQKEEEE